MRAGLVHTVAILTLLAAAGCPARPPPAKPGLTAARPTAKPKRRKKKRSILSRIKNAAKRLFGRTVAEVMGKTSKVSDPRWRGEYCSKDAYFSRFRQDLGYDGLANVGVVKKGVLYRGSQPFIDGQKGPEGERGNGFDTLERMGIKCRILLRTSTRTDTLIDEKKELRKRGIKLFHLPVPSVLYGPPKAKLLGIKVPDRVRSGYARALRKARDRFMRIVQGGEHGPCYLSCQSGRDRTGVLIGWYRAVAQGWKPERIFREQEDCKFEPNGHFLYFRRVFCGWYRERFGRDPVCDAVLGG